MSQAEEGPKRQIRNADHTEEPTEEAEEKVEVKLMTPIEKLQRSLENDEPDATVNLCESFTLGQSPADRCSLLMQVRSLVPGSCAYISYYSRHLIPHILLNVLNFLPVISVFSKPAPEFCFMHELIKVWNN